MESIKFSFSRFVRELLRGSAAHPTLSWLLRAEWNSPFLADEIEQFDMRGKVKRADSNKMPDPYSISQILRGTGSYLDNRDVTTLVGISLNGKWVTVKYETAAGRLEQAKQDLEYFYDYWVKMYLRRSNRAKLPPASDPTLFVTWQGRGAPTACPTFVDRLPRAAFLLMIRVRPLGSRLRRMNDFYLIHRLLRSPIFGSNPNEIPD